MFLNVKDRGATVATLRWIEVRIMETLAAWVPTTPEMEVKLLFGTDIWDAAQHADALGKRAHELRLRLHETREPVAAYVELIGEVAATTETDKRLAGMYDCLLPALQATYRAYLGRVDQLLDNPTVRIVERILGDVDRMRAASRELRDELPALRLGDQAWADDLSRRLAAVEEIVASAAPAADVPADAVTDVPADGAMAGAT